MSVRLSRTLAVLLGVVVVLSLIIGWGYVGLFRALNFADSGAFAALISPLGDTRVVALAIVGLLLGTAAVLLVGRRRSDALVAAVLAVATVLAFLATPVPLTGNGITIAGVGGVLYFHSLLWAAAVALVVAVACAVLAVRTWRAGTSQLR